jgi:putative NADH-flavin reductase
MIQSVAILGADGKLGAVVYEALVKSGFHVTVLKRASSKSQTVHPQTVTIPDDFPVDKCAEALRGQDALVVTIKGSESALQKRLADAAVLAGVQRESPPDSCISLYLHVKEDRDQSR